jgi:hypothetical protein
MQYIIKNNVVTENGNTIATISYTGIYPNINISGSINVDVKKEGREFRIIEGGLPVGKFVKMKVVYMGRGYELERGGYSRIMSFREGMVNVVSLGTNVGSMGWSKGDFVIECERSDLVPLLVLASFLTFFTKKGRGRLASPYREIYYTILAILILYSIFITNLGYNFILDAIVPLILFISLYLVLYFARRK